MPRRLMTIVIALLSLGGAARAQEVTLAAVGDVLLARYVGVTIRKHGADYPLAKVAPTLKKNDLVLFNLECPLSKRGVPTHFKYLFRANPALAKSLRAGGLNVASVANNHTMDYGRTALLDTISALKKAGITPVGAGPNSAAAIRPVVVRVKGLKVGFLAYTDVDNFGVSPRKDRPTTAHVREATLAKEIRAAKRKSDVLVVSFHWGNEYWRKPSERQKRLAKIALAGGADLILGHHPHVLQPAMKHGGKIVVYSMGGFVWDAVRPDRTRSNIYVFRLGKNRAELKEVIPVRIVRCQPRLVGL
ncbi:MAG: CapA family protein [Armatimonadota bacterium]|nr:CapA family protein [Armatimonadota bacterium]